MLPLKKVLLDEHDGRTMNGLAQAVDRLGRLKEHDVNYATAYNLMNNYLAKVRIYKDLRPACIESKSTEELVDLLSVVIRDQATLPEITKNALLKRRIGSLVKVGDLKALVQCLLPNGDGDGKFNPLEPRIATLKITTAEKAAAFERALGEQVLGPLLTEGSTRRASMIEMCNLVEQHFSTLDPIESETCLTELASRCEVAINCIKCLDSKSIDPSVTVPLLRFLPCVLCACLGDPLPWPYPLRQ